MASTWGAVRRLVLTPSLHEVSFDGRGFDIEPTAATRRLEAVPQAVVCGFEWGIADRQLAETERRLSLVAPELAGFAYEGATMAGVIRDVMGPRGHRTKDLLEGGGRPHIFLNYIGIGFAMARLPRPLWKKTLPALTDADLYPQMSWLAVDGYGFDLAYFHTARWVDDQRVPEPYAFEGDAGYFPRAVDQGIGRALWFIHGGHTGHVAAAVRRFAERRQADLWSGVGLAATFAGGSTPAGLAALREDSRGYAAHLAQGSAFAAKARHHAGHVPEHTRQAAHAFLGLDVEATAALADDCAPGAARPADGPAYEAWRRNVRETALAAVV
jgi:enediyne biosynthesis protein E2